ncbi:hypothetical protein CHH28_16005 [Bacterioplanes sanyensis]|uniref:histidine kinase n=1 Tax=Bacterioplanes sanyensis TaxID=1249553 RepID=A0A222FNE6_9GAMM|nr:ATP-binding protein [Bacterioplanes sanyensis]ASP40086.1 hypothetical protein CHH28_16005 [Bacterioplanes sanyensis]
MADTASDSNSSVFYGVRRQSLVWRIILYFASASLALAVSVGAAIAFWNYQQQLQTFEQRMNDIRSSYLESLGFSLWFYDEVQIRTQVQGIENLDAIAYVRVTDNLNLNIERGTRPHRDHIYEMDIEFNGRQLGKLEVAFDRDAVLDAAFQTAVSSIIAQLISMMLLASLLGTVVHRLINRRVRSMAEEVNDRLLSETYEPLSIRQSLAGDEIDILIEAFNSLSAQMNNELQQRTLAQQQLKTVNAELEDRVAERTLNLQRTVDELNHTLSELHNTQSKLIEAEKLSSLGGMVAGIAHEINTPLGLCITIHSYISDNYKLLCERFDSGQMRKQDFVEFNQMMDESLNILDKNLQRAAHLIKSFKQVSEDQTGEHIRDFILRDYLKEVMETLSPKLKQTQHSINIDCSPTLRLQTLPGAISQVITNLVMNSLLHGFENRNDGHIEIICAEERGNVVLRYRDDGIGLSDEAKQKIFDPFYTTKRGHGGTGLGMHLVYNIVNQRLQGEITLEETEQGTAFRLVMPKKIVVPEESMDEDA